MGHKSPKGRVKTKQKRQKAKPKENSAKVPRKKTTTTQSRAMQQMNFTVKKTVVYPKCRVVKQIHREHSKVLNRG